MSIVDRPRPSNDPAELQKAVDAALDQIHAVKKAKEAEAAAEKAEAEAAAIEAASAQAAAAVATAT